MSGSGHIPDGFGARGAAGADEAAARRADESATARSADESAAQLTHELANLLDGSLRQLALALGELTDRAEEAAGPGVPAGGETATIHRLEAASSAMVRMAHLLKRWVSMPGGDAASLYSMNATLGEAVGYVRRLMEPRLVAGGIDLRVELPEEMAGMQAGPIYHVVANGVRNSVEAIVGVDAALVVERSIDVRFERDVEGGELRLTVSDTGPGLDAGLARDSMGHVRAGATTKASGHGLGLAISRQIVESLGGELVLGNREGGGAELRVSWPAGSAGV